MNPGDGDDKDDNGKKGSDEDKACKAFNEDDLPTFSTYNDTTMEYILWIAFLSGWLWVPGLLIGLPLGMIAYGWIGIAALLSLTEVSKGEATFNEWFFGPVWRAWIDGPINLLLYTFVTIIPGLNFIGSYYIAYKANRDYYGPNYLAFAGPPAVSTCESVDDWELFP